MKIDTEKEAIKYLKANRELLHNTYLDGFSPIDEKVVYFTAGPSGAGKTEFIQKFLKTEKNLVHLDIDKIRESVTNRVVPEDVFFNSVIKSRSTTSKIKKLFPNDIILNVVDKRDNQYYQDISHNRFEEIIPKYEE